MIGSEESLGESAVPPGEGRRGVISGDNAGGADNGEMGSGDNAGAAEIVEAGSFSFCTANDDENAMKMGVRMTKKCITEQAI
ncbi:hypothetical protein F511_03597 [Dorcoceras hygrometricum]|uniref:Uncharacterized protein n=1 Tax=Dorcoceras hygrometricum TaxID=472368 RepID=A0A2Z7D407_9LAMI|nr:hypothetical protein F511_03597 [Dorcoceras hygrometricum]